MPVALITGASAGLGRALASSLADHGWTLIIDARDPIRLNRVAAELAERTEVITIAGDVSSAPHRKELSAAVTGWSRLDLLVNNASTLGQTPLPMLADANLEAIAHAYRVNVLAPIGLIQLLLPILAVSGGAVVNISSDAAIERYQGWGGYGSSKAALDQLTGTLAAENPGGLWYSFDPGDMRTDLHQAAFPGEDISDRPEPQSVIPALLHLIRNRPPSGRYRAGDLQAAASEPEPTNEGTVSSVLSVDVSANAEREVAR